VGRNPAAATSHSSPLASHPAGFFALGQSQKKAPARGSVKPQRKAGYLVVDHGLLPLITARALFPRCKGIAYRDFDLGLLLAIIGCRGRVVSVE
jgi:hypothetical protein